MAITKISDVIVPELFNKYVINRTMELSAFFQSGIVVNSPEFDTLASEAARTHNMPFFEDLQGESEATLEDVKMTPAKIGSNKDVSTTILRQKMWGSSNLAAALAGADPAKAIGDLVAAYWARDMQKELIAILKGVFGTVPAGSSGDPAAETRLETNILDISGLSGTKANWSGSAFIDAEQKLGDAKAQLTGVCMHSATEAYLKKQNLIETVQPSDDVAFGLYQGKRVIVDDGCPVADGVYTTYLFGNGAVALGNGNPAGFVPTETDRAKRKGSGVDYLINRKTMILHPRGIAWQNAEVAKTEGPSRTEVANPKNWNLMEMKPAPKRKVGREVAVPVMQVQTFLRVRRKYVIVFIVTPMIGC